jgi:hypothetical protein
MYLQGISALVRDWGHTSKPMPETTLLGNIDLPEADVKSHKMIDGDEFVQIGPVPDESLMVAVGRLHQRGYKFTGVSWETQSLLFVREEA